MNKSSTKSKNNRFINLKNKRFCSLNSSTQKIRNNQSID